MAMELSPQRLREASFAEAWRGYRMDQVRELLDDAADALEELTRRARDADERAGLAEQRLFERVADDELSRTLVLAQRTADAARQEAEAEAARLVREAEERSRALLTEVEARAAQLEREMESRAEAELQQLNERRAALEADVALLADYVERQRGALADELRQLLSWLGRGDHLDAPPVALVGVGDTVASGAADPGPVLGEGADEHTSTPVSEASGASPEAVAPGHERSDGAAADGATPAGVDAGSGEQAWAPPPAKEPHADADADAEQLASQVSASMESDPFLAELRRAVEDDEPLGPRDDDEVWAESGPLFDQDITASGRFRRRRR
jgi:cell division initiation protein